MRKIFLDIGTHNGQTLLLAMKKYPDFDSFIGIEPVKNLVTKSSLSVPDEFYDRTLIFNVALDALDVPHKTVTFYEDLTPGNHHLGSSLLADKTMRKNKKIEVKCMDVNYFFDTMFNLGDDVTMKIDVEGKEYDIFEALMKSGNLKKYVSKIFAEWHWNKVPSISQQRHKALPYVPHRSPVPASPMRKQAGARTCNSGAETARRMQASDRPDP